jgi:hypothetical protein
MCLLHEWKADLVRIWIPMVAGASMLIGLFGGMEIKGLPRRRSYGSGDAIPNSRFARSKPGASDQKRFRCNSKPQQRTRGKARSESGVSDRILPS